MNLKTSHEMDTRLDRARRLPIFERVPTKQDLVRQFIEEGLARLESSPRAAATGEGTVTTDTKGSPR